MSYELTDKKLKCGSCSSEFIFTKGEQEFYLEKAFSEPKRCKVCRKDRKRDKRKKRKVLLHSLEARENVAVELSEPEKNQKKKPEQKETLGVSVGDALESAEVVK